MQHKEALPLLSVVIPTRNRMKYAIPAIRSILRIPSNELELIIQDSSDSDALGVFIQANIGDPRLHYNYSKPPVSGVDNFNIAARFATGEYVSFIGDDDGINPEIMIATQWAKVHDLDAMTPSLCATYYWPDFETRYRGLSHAGRLYLGSFSGAVSFPDMRSEMQKCVHRAGQDFVGLPKVYYGIVKRQCLVQINEQTGVYFNGASPDIYSALAVASLAERVCTIDYPLFVPGSSIASTAGDSARGKHIGRLEEIPHLNARVVHEWPEFVPRFYSVETVRAEAAIKALTAMNRNDLVREFNFPLLHAACAVAHIDHLPQILHSLYRSLHLANNGQALGTLHFVWATLVTLGKRAGYVADRLVHPAPLQRATSIAGLTNIEEAVQALSDQLSASGRTFSALTADTFLN